MRIMIEGKAYKFRPWVKAVVLFGILFILMGIVGRMDNDIQQEQYEQDQIHLESVSK